MSGCEQVRLLFLHPIQKLPFQPFVTNFQLQQNSKNKHIVFFWTNTFLKVSRVKESAVSKVVIITQIYESLFANRLLEQVRILFLHPIRVPQYPWYPHLRLIWLDLTGGEANKYCTLATIGGKASKIPPTMWHQIFCLEPQKYDHPIFSSLLFIHESF